EVTRKFEFRSIFRVPSQKFKIRVIPNVLAHRKSHEHGFTKNETITKSRGKVVFRSIFHAPSQKFKIMTIPNVLALGKLYEHGFIKKCDGHKLFAKSSFDRFFMQSQKFKILTIPNALALGKIFKMLAIPNILAHEKSY
ncbi:hypothetical protein B296_00034769, partial [Ensete ventricosum]